MITEFLSSDSWINPQINYLLYLQDLRIQSGGIFDNMFLSLTRLGEIFFTTLLVCVIYWCIDFKAGLYIFFVNSISLLFSQFLKLVACIYRPWILSDKIHPCAKAIPHAGNYSFPSGHTMVATSIWGSLAFIFRKKWWISCLLVLVILIVAFSRNYLGVHTPQDVIIGFVTGLIFIFASDKIINWCEKDINRYLYVLGCINVFAIITLIYILTKTYPMDYVDGKLLVDPVRAIRITIMYYGWSLGIANGIIICRRFFPFNPKNGTIYAKIVRGLIGLITACGLFTIIEKFVYTNSFNNLISAVIMFVIAFYLTAIYPLIFSKLLKKYM